MKRSIDPWTSASGSQLGPLVSGAAHVILVIGGQKIVADTETGLRRIREYCYPLEDERARHAYGGCQVASTTS